MGGELACYARELTADRALVDAVHPDVFPPTPRVERVLIRTDATSVDDVIMRALALTVKGVEAKLHLEET